MFNSSIQNISRIRKRFPSVQIVDYEPAYIEGALEVAREIHAHSIYRDMPMDEGKVIRQLSGSGILFPERFFKLAVRDGEVLGGFYGTLLRVFFCDELTAKDMGWWVKSDARGSAAAILLLAAFEEWAYEKGCWKVMIGQSGVENIDRTHKLFNHCGYVTTGYNTCKEIRHG